MWPFRRDRTPPEPLRAIIAHEGSPVGVGAGPVRIAIDRIELPEIKIQHVIERKAAPRPTVIQPIILNQEGQEWRTDLIRCDYRHSVPVYFPLAWLTGRTVDNAVQVGMRLELHYEP